jgi:hypothetical protein
MSSRSIASRSARLVYGHFNRFYPHFLAAKRFKERLAFRSFGKEDPAMVAEQDCAVGQRKSVAVWFCQTPPRCVPCLSQISLAFQKNVSPATSKLFFCLAAWVAGMVIAIASLLS